MKNISKFAVVFMLCTGALLQTGCQQHTASPAIPSDPQIEESIKQWLDKMTLEEKIGQMCQITIDVVTDFGASQKNGFTLDKAKLDTVIGKYKVGSLLNVPLSVAQTKEKWAEAIRQIQEVSMKEIGIPCIYGVDQIHGTTYTLDGTMFPQGVNMAATGPRKTECGNLCLRDQGLQHSVELRAGSRFGKRPALVAHVGELWRRLLCERRDGQGNCRRLPGERPEPYREIQRGGLHETLHGLRSTRFRKGPYAFIHLTERHARKTFRPIPCRCT